MFRKPLYLSLRVFTAASYRLRRRLTGAGRLAAVVLVAAAVVGVDTEQTMAHQAFTFLLAVLLLAAVSALVFRGRFSVRRALPPFVTAGEPFVYRTTVTNQGPRTESGLTLLEELADPRPSYLDFATSRDPSGERRNWFDRIMGYHRWRTLVERGRNAEIPERPLPVIPPGASADITTEVTAQRRGRVRFTGAAVARADPFGLFRALARVKARHNLLVLPRRYALPDIPLAGNRIYQHGGVTLATSVGDSEEFIGLRDYRPGDPLQRIHWKSFARVGKPVVREYQDEFFERHALVLDTFAAPGHDERLEEAVAVAASFAVTVETQECLLDLMFVGAEAYTFTSGRGQMQVEDVLEVLAGVRDCRGRPFQDLHDAVLERRDLLSGCILVLLDWDAPRRALIEALRATGLPALVLLVTESAAPIADSPDWLRVLQVGRVQEGLAAL